MTLETVVDKTILTQGPLETVLELSVVSHDLPQAMELPSSCGIIHVEISIFSGHFEDFHVGLIAQMEGSFLK